MNKSQIRKKIINLRKQNSSKKSDINFNYIIKFFKKKKINGKVIGGYYPYNYEIDIIKILNKFENLNYPILLPKIKKKF